jgi:hypothetical protein
LRSANSSLRLYKIDGNSVNYFDLAKQKVNLQANRRIDERNAGFFLVTLSQKAANELITHKKPRRMAGLSVSRIAP